MVICRKASEATKSEFLHNGICFFVVADSAIIKCQYTLSTIWFWMITEIVYPPLYTFIFCDELNLNCLYIGNIHV
ncbi:hypothetical protein C497_06374 [Halalkalicoccus jeotgali B3]|uniref:Uncharacterized protein n=1 Tax=Halalkalicoccus jeotgali (strain DSM 18796 / CECT 7217 / JCM 14584 / KCTC 4019 / B3) TaxID=795797 RepID=D8JCE1_HALJB|nr:hypothetical protein HacjB3_18528 [Halalkalicoccus jeotgali B3]ELY38786.1 hypothetical protein C497_06374 [Halalkalicoccus jeotgali B3]